MKRIPETLNESEIKALLSQPNKRARTGLRDLAMIRFRRIKIERSICHSHDGQKVPPGP